MEQHHLHYTAWPLSHICFPRNERKENPAYFGMVYDLQLSVSLHKHPLNDTVHKQSSPVCQTDDAAKQV